MVKFPFIEERINDEISVRTFSNDLVGDDLLWHWDDEDRIIETLQPTDWMFQFDNSLPEKIEKKIYIQKGVWHRLIKGNGDLKLRIEKIK